MTAGIYNLVIEQGATFSRALVIEKDGSPWDISGYEVRAQIRKTFESADVLQHITVVVTDPVAGEVTLTIIAADTAGLPITNAVWDLELDDQAGTPVVRRLLKGKVEIVPEVTK